MRLWVVLLICFLIRLPGLNQSLWLDEAISANVVRNYDYREIVAKFSPADFHPPGYYLILKIWTTIFGSSEIGMRLLSVLASLIAIYIVYLLGGINAAWLVGLNPLLVYYSQETRMYSLVTMIMILAVYMLVKKKYLISGIICGLGFLTFYGSVFLIVAMGIYLIFNKKFKELGNFMVGPILALIIIWPLLSEQMKYSKEVLPLVTNWDLVLGKVNIKNLLLIPMKFTSGRISFYPKIIYYLIAGGWGLFVFGNLFRINLYSFLFWATLGIGTIFSIFTPMMQYFRFLYLIPIMGLIIKENKIIAGGFLIFSLVYLFNPKFYREDWKTLTREAPEKVYMIESFGDPVKYYEPGIGIQDFHLLDGQARIEPKEDMISVIPYGEEIHGFDHEKYLTSLGYRKIKEISYRELLREDWIR